MSIDWQDVFSSAVDAAIGAADEKKGAAKKYIRQVIEAREERLRLLMEAWADGALDDESLEEELEEEKRIVRMELLAIQVLTKKAAQDAVNAFFKVIGDALKQGIDILV
jgi:hypothetical protein